MDDRREATSPEVNPPHQGQPIPQQTETPPIATSSVEERFANWGTD